MERMRTPQITKIPGASVIAKMASPAQYNAKATQHGPTFDQRVLPRESGGRSYLPTCAWRQDTLGKEKVAATAPPLRRP